MFQIPDLALQLDLTARLLLASFLGAVIGLEREIHEHPAGMRTHLLVAFGSALFTAISIHGFVLPAEYGPSTPPDPSRIAAQVVTGIGFLGAGAILKYGTTIRGLTTAGSLWATSAIGMSAGAGQFVLAVVGTGIVGFSLWPLNRIVERLRSERGSVVRVRLQIARIEALAAVTRELHAGRIEMTSIQSRRMPGGRYEIELHLRPPVGTRPEVLIAKLTELPEVELLETTTAEE